MNEFDEKAHAASRRKQKLTYLRDGISWADRTIEPKSVYNRRIKYRPQSPQEWDELEF